MTDNSFRKGLVALKRAVWWIRKSRQKDRLLAGFLGLLWQKNSLDVWQNTTLGNGHAGEEFVQFLVVADSQLKMSGDDPGLLVVSGSVTCKLEHLSG